MKEVQDEAENASKIDDTLKNYERELQIVQVSSAQMQKRLNDVTIEQAFPQEQDNHFKKSNLHLCPILTHLTEMQFTRTQQQFFWDLHCFSIFGIR